MQIHLFYDCVAPVPDYDLTGPDTSAKTGPPAYWTLPLNWNELEMQKSKEKNR